MIFSPRFFMLNAHYRSLAESQRRSDGSKQKNLLERILEAAGKLSDRKDTGGREYHRGRACAFKEAEGFVTKFKVL